MIQYFSFLFLSKKFCLFVMVGWWWCLIVLKNLTFAPALAPSA